MKKKMKKKALKKVFIPRRPVAIPETNAAKIAALISLEATEGWAIVLQILQENKQFLESMLISGVDGITGEKLTEKEIEETRFKHAMTIELINTPQNYIRQLNLETQDVVDFDPYFKQ